MLLAQSGFLSGFSKQEGEVPKQRHTRSRNKDRYFTAADMRFTRMYFSENPGFGNKDFERRFCNPYALFERICHKITGFSLFMYRKVATRKVEISPRMRIISALRILSYRMGSDEIDDLCEISYNSARESFYAFKDTIIELFGAEYHRAPREEDSRRILPINSSRGFPGCISS